MTRPGPQAIRCIHHARLRTNLSKSGRTQNRRLSSADGADGAAWERGLCQTFFSKWATLGGSLCLPYQGVWTCCAERSIAL
jgi:hypothetical protein